MEERRGPNLPLSDRGAGMRAHSLLPAVDVLLLHALRPAGGSAPTLLLPVRTHAMGDSIWWVDCPLTCVDPAAAEELELGASSPYHSPPDELSCAATRVFLFLLLHNHGNNPSLL